MQMTDKISNSNPIIGEEMARVPVGRFRTLVLSAEPPRMGVPARVNVYVEAKNDRPPVREVRKFVAAMSDHTATKLVAALQESIEKIRSLSPKTERRT